MTHRRIAFAILLLTSACTDETPRTQVMLEIDADDAVRADLATLRVLVDASDDGGKTWQHRFTETFDDKRVGGWSKFEWPARLGLVPEGDEFSRRFNVRAQALDAGGHLYVWQSAVAGFTKEHTTVLRMTLSAACVAMEASCGDPSCVGTKDQGCETCIADTCDDVELATLKDFDPDAKSMDASTDAGEDRDAESGGDADTQPNADGGGDHGDGGSKPSSDAGPGDDNKDSGPGEEPGPPQYHVFSSTPDLDDPVITDDDGVVQVKFSAPVDPESVTFETFIVSRNGIEIDGEFSIGKTTVAFTPDDPWVLGARYHLKLIPAIQDADGNPLKQFELDFAFREGEWTKAPRAENVLGARIAAAPGGDAVLGVGRMGTSALDIAGSRFLIANNTWEAELPVTSGVGGFTFAAINDKHHPVLAASTISANFAGYTYLNGPTWIGAGDHQLAGENPGAFLDLHKDELYAVVADGMDNLLYGLDFTLGAVSPASAQIGDASGYNKYPSVALLDGDPRVAWRRSPDGNIPWHIVAGTFDTTEPTTLSDVGSDAQPPTLVSNQRQSSAMVVWEQTDMTWHNVWVSRISTSGVWTQATRVSDNTSSAQEPKVAIDDQTRALVVWQQDGGIVSIGYTAADGWSDPAQPISADALNADPPQVVLEPGGNGFAAWTQDGSEMALNEVWVARYVAGKGWQDAQRISGIEAGTASTVSLAIDNRGRAFVAWVEANQAWVARFE